MPALDDRQRGGEELPLGLRVKLFKCGLVLPRHLHQQALQLLRARHRRRVRGLPLPSFAQAQIEITLVFCH